MAISETLDAVLRQAVDAGDVPGVAAILTDGEHVLYHGTAGVRRLGDAAPIETDTVFWIHSMTKPIAAAAIMHAVEAGKLALDDDCGALVPALANPQVLDGFDGDGAPILRPAKGAITLRRLLTHTAGFVYEMWNENHKRWLAGLADDSVRMFDPNGTCQALGFDPGARWEYGVNIDWAGRVLEAAVGESLDDYARRHILAPLGMADTGYRLTDEIRARLSCVHQRDAEGVLAAVDFDPPREQDPRTFTGGGGMYGTAEDYAKFMAMILNDGGDVLQPDTVRQMASNNVGDTPVTGLPTAMPKRTNAFDFFPGVEKRWGLSFMINMDDLPGARRAGSLTWAGLRNSYFWVDRTSGLGGAIFTQLLPFADHKALALYDAFERAAYATTKTG